MTKITVTQTNPEALLKEVSQALDNGLTAEENFNAKLLTGLTTHAVANTEFTVTHALGRVPSFFVANTDANAVVYESSRGTWTDQIMKLKCSGSSVGLRLLVM